MLCIPGYNLYEMKRVKEKELEKGVLPIRIMLEHLGIKI